MSSGMSAQVSKRSSFLRKLFKSRNKSQDNGSLRQSRDENDSDISISAQAFSTPQPQSVDYTAGDEGQVSVPSQAPPNSSEQYTPGNREAVGRDGKGPDSSDAPPITAELYSVDRGDEDVQGGEATSTSFFQGSSNVKMVNSNFNKIHGNATTVQFGNGQFTDIQRNLICDYISRLNGLRDMNDNLNKHALTQPITTLPCAEAVFNDYQAKKKSGPCFEGTRVELLREMANWAIGPDDSKMYVLSGLAGTGKSTVAYTIASRAADLNLLGASFFFSRDEADRNNAKKFFTTIAYQLCVYDETFSKAIGDVLKTEKASVATTKDPQTQLQALILEPLRSIVQSRPRPILIVVDALDECDDEDAFSVLSGLNQLVRSLPSFKVILTTRPQAYLDAFLGSQGGHNIFHLQDIEDKVVDGDIGLYLKHSLSLEQVQKHYPKRQWCAPDEEIDSLVRSAGRLFIIASTAVRYIFDKAASDPEAQMQKLLHAFAQDSTPFKDLDHFYTIILRNVIPANCDDDDVLNRYQIVVGAIVLVQHPLPISALADLINMDVDDIRAVLDNLQSVVLLGGDGVPRIYHKSFSDYLTDQAHCQDPRLLIDTRIRHTHFATRCFEIMNKHLKRNILGLGDPARFMSNKDGLKKAKIKDKQLQEKIPQQLRYACVYWANHFGVANIEETDVMSGLERFANAHMLYWFEVLSLIDKLGSAHHAILLVLKSTSSDLHQLLSDALRFISQFYKLIEQSALHTYYSALPFTPSNSLFYQRYMKEVGHGICSIEGGPEKWDALVANLGQGEKVNVVKFSLDSTLFVSCSQGQSNIWDAATGTPISTIPGHRFAVANDFSTIVSSGDNTITVYNVNGSARGTMFTTSSKIQNLALSSESSRVAAALSDRTVWLWDSGNAKLIDSFESFDISEDGANQLKFSPTGTRLAYSSANGVKLQDGVTGRFIANLRCGSSHKFEFSGDGSRLASVSRDDSLTLWNTESGGLIAAARNVGQHGLAISANGSLLATADLIRVKLWSVKGDNMAQIKELQLDMPHDMTFSLDNTLAIATSTGVRLYDVKSRTLVSSLLTDGFPTALAFSPDYTRLVFGTEDGRMYLWDIRENDTSSPSSDRNVTAVTLSRDCSRLACGLVDGRVELWGTSPTMQRIVLSAPRWIIDTVLFRNYRHPHQITALGFSPDDRLFASGSYDGTVKLWNSGDGSLRGTVKAPDSLRAVAVSNSVLVAGCDHHVTLWSLDTLSLIHTSTESGGIVSIAENSALIAVARDRGVSLLDALSHTTIATFDTSHEIHAMAFLPDNSQLVAQSEKGNFTSIDLINKHLIKGPIPEHLIQLPNTPCWHGIPILHCQDKKWRPQNEVQHYFSALSSQHEKPVPILWIPRELGVAWEWTQGSSMIALCGRGGRIILLRLPIRYHVD